MIYIFYRNRFCLMSVVMLYAITVPQTAHAYLDAGTGSYLIQFAIAFIAGGLFVVKSFWHKVFSFFSIGKKKSSEETNHHSRKEPGASE